MMSNSNSKPEPLEIKLIDPSCQPSAAELAEDLRVDATFG